MSDKLTTAVCNLPEEFISIELVMAAAKEHNPELLNHLPAKYLTEDVINEVFAGKEENYWWRCDLSRIPEQHRTQDICIKALRCTMENLPFVPTKYIDLTIAEKIISSSDSSLQALTYIPRALWNEVLVYKALEKKGINRCAYGHTERLKQEKLKYHYQIILSYAPESIKTHAFYQRFFEKEYVPEVIDLLTPKQFKDETYYQMMARADCKLVPISKMSYCVVLALLETKSRHTLHDIFGNAQIKERVMSLMDDTLADAVVVKETNYFRALPEKYQTEKRLILAVQTTAKDYRGSYYRGNYDKKLLTLSVVKEFVKQGVEVEVPKKIWTEAFVRYCFEHGQKSFFWFQQMPRKFQSREIVDAAVRYSYGNLEYAVKKHISREITIETMRHVLKNDRGYNNRYIKFLPQSHFTEFKKKTGLGEMFMGGKEVDFITLKEKRVSHTYCRLGNLYIGFYHADERHEKSPYLIITRVERGKEPEVLFDKYISTFHKTWLEKPIAEYNPEFVKPTVDPSLKDVQGVGYYGVEFVENTDGFEVYKNTFCGITVGYCVKKDGLTCHADTVNHAMNGWEQKVDSEKTAQASEAQAASFDDRVLTATMLHSRYGFCELGMTAFSDDYGLDYNGRYKVSELRQIVALQGHKPSVVNYRQELRRIRVI